MGFSPSLPTGYSWCLPGQRKRVPSGPAPWLDAVPFEQTLTSDDLIAYLKALPWAEVPRVVALDNTSLHVSKVVKAARPDLAKLGIYLYYLPAYSPGCASRSNKASTRTARNCGPKVKNNYARLRSR